MTLIEREFRLTNEPGGLGLSCGSDGLSLAGVPLLRKAATGFMPRPAREIGALLKAAYDEYVISAELLPRLDAVARALNRGDLAHAMVAAVLMRMPELSWRRAARVARTDEALAKYDPDEPRDWHGRWTSGGAGVAEPVRDRPASSEYSIGQERSEAGQSASPFDSGVDERNPLLIPASATTSPDDAKDDDQTQPSREQELKSKYDDLGPVEFAKQVTQFGDWLGREGRHLSPAEQADALTEYRFLQNRLSSWLNYDYKPPESQGNLISAATTLYVGAMNGGIISVGGEHGELPATMLDVAGVAAGIDDALIPVGPRRSSSVPSTQEPRLEKPLGVLGDVVSNDEVGIVWGGGIKNQGKPWEVSNAKKLPGAELLPPGNKTFDLFDMKTGEAISSKTLDTLTMTYINDPREIYRRLKGYIDAAADHEPQWNWELDATVIKSRTLQLAVPDFTSPTQWRQIERAIRYGADRGAGVVVTRVGSGTSIRTKPESKLELKPGPRGWPYND